MARKQKRRQRFKTEGIEGRFVVLENRSLKELSNVSTVIKINHSNN